MNRAVAAGLASQLRDWICSALHLSSFLPAGVAEWQTQGTQNPTPVGSRNPRKHTPCRCVSHFFVVVFRAVSFCFSPSSIGLAHQMAPPQGALASQLGTGP